MGPNFTSCGDIFQPLSNTTYIQYRYNGSIHGVLNTLDRPALITIQGCYELCGDGYTLYDSLAWTTTVTTWILPVLGGLLLQAPFESNRFRRTVSALLRWLGSPIGSLTYVFWNIKALGKCAYMVEIATNYAERPGDPNSAFGRIRDSFYILSVMNQFSIPPVLPNMSAERLLRIALFSDTLVISDDDGGANMISLRGTLAVDLRSRSRRGAVPVFISLGWFSVSLAISIWTAFGNVGERATALNLALGLMLGWLPVFVLACIVDRSTLSTNHVQNSLNAFIDTVRQALLHPDYQNTYVVDQDILKGNLAWTEDLRDDLFKNFFLDFAGQGRTRWHYGLAHSILAGVEDLGVADVGPGWLHRMENVHDRLVLGPTLAKGLHYFYWGEIWQFVQAFSVVWGTLAGAFIISFCTPTFGLGCRSGGYLIFAILTLFSFILELFVWLKLSTEYKGPEAIHVPLPGTPKRQNGRKGHFKNRPWQSRLVPIFTLFDMLNTAWLVYITSSQVFGMFETCDCVGSAWGWRAHGPGGYIDFLSVINYKAQGITTYWWAGTGLSLGVICIASIYIVIEWCTQSHLSTENYENALDGLRHTRRWKRYTHWLPRLVLRSFMALWDCFCACSCLFGSRRDAVSRNHRSLVGSSTPTYRSSQDEEMRPWISSNNIDASARDPSEIVLRSFDKQASTTVESVP